MALCRQAPDESRIAFTSLARTVLGQEVFDQMSGDDDETRVYIIRPDGTDLLATNLAAYTADLKPDLSGLAVRGLDGILYSSNVDGTGIATFGHKGYNQKWAPGGTELAFGATVLRSRGASPSCRTSVCSWEVMACS